MQQQISQQQEQYGNHQQMSQPMMICPIQYVYESPMLIPQAQEEQIQQNQILLNVQNPPPWIQNRPQNQVIYVQQVPNNYQTYIHPHMIQNPIYHPQINYQIQQPILAQDNRQYVQIPNLAHYNTVQNTVQPAQAPPQQQVNSDEAEKMPLLTQMLNQKSGLSNVRAPNASNVRPTTSPANNVNVNMSRPVTQNQQVQTNISANNKGRQRNGPPQIITINPMQQRQYVNVNQKPDVVINITRPAAPYMRTDVPQHIRSKIPSSISVKTVGRSVQLRPLMRPFDVMPGPQNFIYNHSLVAPPNPQTRNMMTNTESSYLKQNNNQGDRSSKTLDSNIPATAKMPVAKDQDESATIHKQQIDANVTAKSKLDLVKTTDNNAEKMRTGMNVVRNTENQTQTEEKLIRNTVYVQARGRVLTEKEIAQNRSPKRSIEEETANSPNIHEDLHKSNKHARIEVTDNTSQTNNFGAKTPTNFTAQQTRINNLSGNSDNTKSTNFNIGEPDKMTNVHLGLNNQKSAISNPTTEVNTNLEQKTALYDKNSSNREEITTEDSKKREIPKAVDDSSVFREESNLRDLKQKYDDKGGKIEVLTHVLDGYIIQESNVAFPIYKPIVEKENRQDKEQKETNPRTDDRTEDVNETYTASSNVSNNMNTSMEEKEPVAINKDNPFANIQKSTVESWTTEELASHLEKYDWRETAAKLQDEEIDGQSILLVNRDQLITIGVCDSHAEVIAAFSAS